LWKKFCRGDCEFEIKSNKAAQGTVVEAFLDKGKDMYQRYISTT
jgi:hypothetical protein